MEKRMLRQSEENLQSWVDSVPHKVCARSKFGFAIRRNNVFRDEEAMFCEPEKPWEVPGYSSVWDKELAPHEVVHCCG